MQPNDLPIVCLPLELCARDAAELIDFLNRLVEALERHYGGLLINRAHQLELSCPPGPANTATDDQPF
ncbi:MAG TPA: hypothetical protein VGG63_20725 [Steroidobacteraceae bacterium]|jgi:hypothetical protein